MHTTAVVHHVHRYILVHISERNSPPPSPARDRQLYNRHVLVLLYIGWVGVVGKRCCKTRLSLPKLDNKGTVWGEGVTMPGGQVTVDRLCGVESLTSAQGKWSYHEVCAMVYGTTPTRQSYIAYESIAVSEGGQARRRKKHMS